jgi:hypothetical protein
VPVVAPAAVVVVWMVVPVVVGVVVVVAVVPRVLVVAGLVESWPEWSSGRARSFGLTYAAWFEGRC